MPGPPYGGAWVLPQPPYIAAAASFTGREPSWSADLELFPPFSAREVFSRGNIFPANIEPAPNCLRVLLFVTHTPPIDPLSPSLSTTRGFFSLLLFHAGSEPILPGQASNGAWFFPPARRNSFLPRYFRPLDLATSVPPAVSPPMVRPKKFFFMLIFCCSSFCSAHR